MNIIKVLAGLFLFLTATALNAQVAIGKQTLTNTSVLLEFNAEAKGIILPSVLSAPGAVGGTFVFNTADKSIQVFQNAGWTLLTDSNQGVVHSFSNSGNESGTGMIIGANISAKPGVLVMESTTKAMVLPKAANPHLNIRGAIAGTMVYDTVSSSLAVYDGAQWSYWK
ncbi:hypothetical protein QE422_002175 [Chryseobacterium sp. SORGH_AS 447]|uniref:hypothetical protein n=1 Tax=Chryseobacterium sp. SORGH_AS_0447 TaxID=3041769 RepID=UPI00278B3198|nr:hypothetical protein [Chryseobacterium sp. SORGH_AS_0447]MDQ1161807.1 hypothetical protein [Chryseobacterium sp. SORGH_AS_0447]